MSRRERFTFRNEQDLMSKATELGVELPFSRDCSALLEKAKIVSHQVPNRLAVHPMEGFDSATDGSPSDRVFRRYRRYARGGSGLIWFEAASVSAEGKSNPRQMMLTEQNIDSFKFLIEETKRSARESFGDSHDVFCVLQLTHSGRFSQPEGNPQPQTAQFIPGLDKDEMSIQILSDRELDALQDRFVIAAGLAHSAGFDAVDIKACHGYLVNDLLAAHKRRDSRYGGTFSNRTRFLLDTTRKIREEIPEMGLAVRLSLYDGIPFPHGFGVAKEGYLSMDLEEPMALVDLLVQSGCSLLNITLGNPHRNPDLGRPADRSLSPSNVPREHPLEGLGRLLKLTAKIQRMFPRLPCVGTGYSWLRYFFPHVGAAAVARGDVSLIGLGRSSFAYPDAPRDLMEHGHLNPKKTCVTCSCCTQLIRAGLSTGCVVRDRIPYAQEYKRYFIQGEKG